VAVLFNDITEARRAEEAIRENRAMLHAALASMADAVFISDAGGQFIEINDAFATFHRFKNTEECAQTFAEYPDLLDVFLPDGTIAPVDMWAVRGPSGRGCHKRRIHPAAQGHWGNLGGQLQLWSHSRQRRRDRRVRGSGP